MHGTNPWTKRLAGPTSMPGPGIVHKHAQPVQFSGPVERHTPHIDTIGAIMAGDGIVLDSMSPTKTLGGSNDSLRLSPFTFADDKSDVPQLSKEPKDLV